MPWHLYLYPSTLFSGGELSWFHLSWPRNWLFFPPLPESCPWAPSTLLLPSGASCIYHLWTSARPAVTCTPGRISLWLWCINRTQTKIVESFSPNCFLFLLFPPSMVLFNVFASGSTSSTSTVLVTLSKPSPWTVSSSILTFFHLSASSTHSHVENSPWGGWLNHICISHSN